MKPKLFFCDKCNREKLKEEMNPQELQELKKEGSFVCSTCINFEINLESLGEYKENEILIAFNDWNAGHLSEEVTNYFNENREDLGDFLEAIKEK